MEEDALTVPSLDNLLLQLDELETYEEENELIACDNSLLQRHDLEVYEDQHLLNGMEDGRPAAEQLPEVLANRSSIARVVAASSCNFSPGKSSARVMIPTNPGLDVHTGKCLDEFLLQLDALEEAPASRSSSFTQHLDGIAGQDGVANTPSTVARST